MTTVLEMPRMTVAEPPSRAGAAPRGRETVDRDGAAGDPSHWVRWALLATVLLALALRVAAVFALGAWEEPSAMEHRPVAIALLNGDGFWFRDWGWYGPSSVQSPPYPLLVAGAFKIFGVDAPAAYVSLMMLNAIAGAAAVWLTFRLVLAVGGSAVTGLIAAGLLAVWPTQIYAVTVAQAVCLITALTLGLVLLWLRSMDTGRVGPWVAFSVIGCLGALTEPVLLPAMALSGLLVFAWRGRGMTPPVRLRNAALLLLAAVVVIGPWTLRNRLVHGQFVPIKSTFWVNVWKGNNPHATGTDRPALSAEKRAELAAGMSDDEVRSADFDNVRQYDLLTAAEQGELRGRSEVEREAVFARWAKGWIGENPAGYLRLCGVRLVKTLWVEWDNPKGVNAVYYASRTALLVLTPVGLVLAWRRGWRMGYALFVAATCLLTYVLTITAARFALPFEPMQLGLVGGSRRRAGRTMRRDRAGMTNDQVRMTNE